MQFPASVSTRLRRLSREEHEMKGEKRKSEGEKKEEMISQGKLEVKMGVKRKGCYEFFYGCLVYLDIIFSSSAQVPKVK